MLITTVLVPAGLAAGGKEAPAMASRLYRVILPVTDIDRAAGFYAGLLQKDGERVSIPSWGDTVTTGKAPAGSRP